MSVETTDVSDIRTGEGIMDKSNINNNNIDHNGNNLKIGENGLKNVESINSNEFVSSNNMSSKRRHLPPVRYSSD
jgi:hypothetical protein